MMMKHFLLSILLHIVLLICFIAATYHFVHHKKNQQYKIIQTYLISKLSLQKNIHLKKMGGIFQTQKTQENQKQKVSSHKNNYPNSLLTLLHNQIQNAIVYPAMLSNFTQGKMMRVSFILKPNGMIQKAQILKSSHNEILDKAVTAAIFDIQPVNQAKLYLQSPTILTLNIQFQS